MADHKPVSRSRMDGRLARRTLLQSCAALATSGVVGRATEPASRPADDARTLPPLPTAPLGKTGVRVTRLGIGAGYPSYGRRLLEHAYRRGLRYFDNAYGYGNGQQERELGRWVSASGRRADLFVVTKAGFTSTRLFYDKVVRALEALQLDTIDLFCIHGLEDPAVVLDRGRDWQGLKTRLLREKRIRLMGFSTHAEMPARVQCVANAATSGWVDALMVACDPLLLRTHDALNRALDACVTAGVGLVAMKTTRSLGRKAADRRGLPEGQAPTETMPGFEERGLSAFAAVHQGVWSDGRFAAVCSAMLDFAKIDENAANARAFRQPLGHHEWRLLEDGMRKLTRVTCPDCDGSCRRAAGTSTDFCSIARYLAYAEQDGNRQLARRLYAGLPTHARDWTGGDLAAASRDCKAKLDFSSLLDRAKRLLA